MEYGRQSGKADHEHRNDREQIASLRLIVCRPGVMNRYQHAQQNGATSAEYQNDVGPPCPVDRTDQDHNEQQNKQTFHRGVICHLRVVVHITVKSEHASKRQIAPFRVVQKHLLPGDALFLVG